MNLYEGLYTITYIKFQVNPLYYMYYYVLLLILIYETILCSVDHITIIINT